MKKVLSLLATACVGGALFSATAQAQPIPVKFESADYFAWGRLYDAAGSPTNLNPWDGSAGQSLAPLGAYKGGDGTEDAFGITRVTKISNLAGTQTFFQSDPSKELTVFFYGADDVKLTDLGGGISRLLSNSFTADFYLDTPISVPYDPSVGTGGRGPATMFAGATEGTLALRLHGHTLFDGGDPTKPYQLDEIGNATTGAFSGSIFFDVDKFVGDWRGLYDTDTKLAPDGNFADFVFTFTTLPNEDPGKVADWVIRDVSHLEGAVVPEPGTIVLLGGGLLGLGVFARMRKAQK